MQNPINRFKAAIAAGQSQIGVWNSIGGNTACEVLASAGFDWVLVDTEHAATSTAEVLPALQAIAGYPDVSAIVRPASNDEVTIKRVLDMGAQTLLIPYVQNVDEARAAVAAMRYAPRGIRGMAGVMRATRFGAVENYADTVEAQLCLIVQVETIEAMAQLEDIAQVDGVDAVFIGPADLSASMGLPGQTGHPDVVAVIDQAIARLKAIGVPAGILATNQDSAAHFIAQGTTFTAVGVDSMMLAQAARELRAGF